jgi:hypothetical protein
MSNLEPDVLFSQWRRWHGNNVSETLQTISDGVTGLLASGCSAYLKTLLVLLLLLVNYTEPEVDLVRLFEVRLHAHYLRKGLFGVLKRPVSIVEDADAIPKFGFLIDVSAI